jgi:DNA-binding transcriptional ArsR family regulator
MDLGLPPAAIRLEMRKLTRAGVVDRIGRTRRRGVSEFLYSMDLGQNLLRPGELLELPGDRAVAAQAQLLRQLYDEAMEAIEARTFYARNEFALIRFAIPLDDRGWEDARRLCDDLTYSIIKAFEEAKARTAGRHAEETFQVSAAVGLFEPVSPWPTPLTEQDQAGSTRRASRRQGREAMAGLNDPLRMKILDVLSLAPAGVGEMAERLGASREKIRYELGGLREAGVVDIHSRRRRRGTEENVYFCQNKRLVLGANDVSKFDQGEVESFCRDTIADIFRGALASMEDGMSKDRDDSGLARVPGRIDCQGFNKISDLITTALDGFFELREECTARLTETGGPSRPAISSLILFERP